MNTSEDGVKGREQRQYNRGTLHATALSRSYAGVAGSRGTMRATAQTQPPQEAVGTDEKARARPGRFDNQQHDHIDIIRLLRTMIQGRHRR
eukprot:2950884-Pyramimonas_sp.AAC.1